MTAFVVERAGDVLRERLAAFREGALQRYLPKTDVGLGFLVSGSIHGAIVGGILIAMWIGQIEKPDPIELNKPLITFNLPGIKTEAENEDVIPAIAPPKSSEKPSTEEPVTAPPSPIAIMEGGTGNDQFVWTPPPPDALLGVGGTENGLEEARVYLKDVEMPKGASDPVLLSFDQARINEAAELTEAARLSGKGAMKMSVNVGEDGNPISCDITDTSGSKLLDERGCALVMSYFYRPAQDRAGNPRMAMVFETLEWVQEANGQTAGLVVPGSENIDPESQASGSSIVDIDAKGNAATKRVY